jgi:hypothetical protein
MRAAVVCLALICGAHADLEPDMFNEEFEMPDMEELTTDSVQAHHHEPIRQELQGCAFPSLGAPCVEPPAPSDA